MEERPYSGFWDGLFGRDKANGEGYARGYDDGCMKQFSVSRTNVQIEVDLARAEYYAKFVSALGKVKALHGKDGRFVTVDEWMSEHGL